MHNKVDLQKLLFKVGKSHNICKGIHLDTIAVKKAGVKAKLISEVYPSKPTKLNILNIQSVASVHCVRANQKIWVTSCFGVKNYLRLDSLLLRKQKPS